MQQSIIDIFFALLRYSLDVVPPQASSELSSRAPTRDLPFVEPLSDDDWKRIFAISKKQALIGVIYSAVQRLPQDLQPPKELMDKWNQIVRQIIIRNTRMNATAAQLTQMFEEKGRKTVILKGQANALLYPEPLLRQAGDIDILVEGGRSTVLKLLKEMGVMEDVGIDEISNLHVHLNSNKFSCLPLRGEAATSQNVIPGSSQNVTPASSQNVIPAPEPGPPTRKGVSVEIHFAPTYNNSPFTTRTMCEFLAQQTSKPGAVKLSDEGFNCPPMTFALVMQLSHLQRHYFGEGIGLRQLVDYHQLLVHSTAEDRALVRDNLRKTGLYHIAQAVMWVMEQIFALPREQMLCTPDERRGRLLLENVMEGGNFGKYSEAQKLPVFSRWLNDRLRPFRRFAFDIPESLWHEGRYVVNFTRYIPKRIKYRKISVRKV